MVKQHLHLAIIQMVLSAPINVRRDSNIANQSMKVIYKSGSIALIVNALVPVQHAADGMDIDSIAVFQIHKMLFTFCADHCR